MPHIQVVHLFILFRVLSSSPIFWSSSFAYVVPAAFLIPSLPLSMLFRVASLSPNFRCLPVVHAVPGAIPHPYFLVLTICLSCSRCLPHPYFLVLTLCLRCSRCLPHPLLPGTHPGGHPDLLPRDRPRAILVFLGFHCMEILSPI